MPQGSGVSHLMPAPHYVQVVVVAKGRANEETLQQQVNKIGDAAANKRYKIELEPGIYAESILMRSFIDVVAPYGRAIVQPPVTATTGITMVANSTISGIEVDMSVAGAVSTGVVVGDVANVVIDECYVYGGGAGDIGISDATTGATLYIRRTRVEGHATSYQKTGIGTTVVEDCRMVCANDGIDADVNAGTLNVYDSELLGQGSGANIDVAAVTTVNSFHNDLTGDGFQVANAADAVVISRGDNYSNVTFAGAAGVFVDITDCMLYASLAGVAVGEWVYVSGVETVAEALASALATMPSIGVVVYKPTATTCYVKQKGYYYSAAAPFVTASTYWISDAVAGTITAVMPGIWPQQAGVAVSTVQFKILLGENLGLINTNVYNNAGGAVAVNNWVYITAVNNEVAPARANAAATMPSIGVVVEVINATTCRVRGDGKHSQATLAFVASEDVYVSAAVAGAIVNVAPVIGIVQKVGEVKSDDGVNTIVELA